MTDNYRMTLRIPIELHEKIKRELGKSDVRKPTTTFILECVEKYLRSKG